LPNKIKLPSINSNRTKENKISLNDIISEYNEHKKDPVIRKKLNNILNDISDIKKVILSKEKNRIKISSAPTGIFEDENNFTFSQFPKIQHKQILNQNPEQTISINNRINSNVNFNLNFNVNTNTTIKDKFSKEKISMRSKGGNKKFEKQPLYY
jgi:hypothetical protein